MVGIKDFGMPSCCTSCEMSSCKGWGNFYCDITLEEVDMDSNKRDKDCPLVEVPQADHKADMVAMLKEIQKESEKEAVRWYVGRVDGKSDDVVLIDTLREIIQEKIDKLKEVEDADSN